MVSNNILFVINYWDNACVRDYNMGAHCANNYRKLLSLFVPSNGPPGGARDTKRRIKDLLNIRLCIQLQLFVRVRKTFFFLNENIDVGK